MNNFDRQERYVQEIAYERNTLRQENANLKAELASLRAKNERLKAERSWIPVKERLPEAWVKVLTESPDGNYWIVHWNNFDERWVEVHMGRIMIGVAHWMPLPEPPEVDERLE